MRKGIYEIRHRESNRNGYIKADPTYSYNYACSEYVDMPGLYSEKYCTLAEASKNWVIPKSVKVKLWLRAHRYHVLMALVATALSLLIIAPVTAVFIVLTCTWDYHTGQDTGYISAVDRMNFSDDRVIYLRRRPLDSQGYTTAEKDETTYCTTADHQEVIDMAYEAMANGKRVILVYDTPREFGWRAIGHCNEAPITEIRYAEE